MGDSSGAARAAWALDWPFPKSLMELHGGRIAAASTGLNQGATFSIAFPAAILPSAGLAALLRPNPAAVRCAFFSWKITSIPPKPCSACWKTSGNPSISPIRSPRPSKRPPRGTHQLLLSDLGLPDGTGIDLIQPPAHILPPSPPLPSPASAWTTTSPAPKTPALTATSPSPSTCKNSTASSARSPPQNNRGVGVPQMCRGMARGQLRGVPESLRVRP